VDFSWSFHLWKKSVFSTVTSSHAKYMLYFAIHHCLLWVQKIRNQKFSAISKNSNVNLLLGLGVIFIFEQRAFKHFFAFVLMQMCVCLKEHMTVHCVLRTELKFLDIKNYIAPGFDYAKFITAYDVEQQKFDWPYEWFQNFQQLDEPLLPPHKAFHSSLKTENISQEAYTLCQTVWKDKNGTSMRDHLEYYNNLDVEPFLQAVEKLFNVNKELGLDVFKSSPTLPGLTLQLMFSDLPPGVYLHSYQPVKLRPPPADQEICLWRVERCISSWAPGWCHVHPPSRVWRKCKAVQKDPGVRRKLVIPGSTEACHANWTLYALPIGELQTVHVSPNRTACNAMIGMGDGWEAGSSSTSTMAVKCESVLDSCRWMAIVQRARPSFDFMAAGTTATIAPTTPTNRPIKLEEDLAIEKPQTCKRKQEKSAYLRGCVENLMEIYEYEWMHQCKTSDRKKKFIEGLKTVKPWYDLTQEKIIRDVQNGKLFGMLLCDIETPEELKLKFEEFCLIFETTMVSRDDIGEHMREYAEQNNVFKKPRRMLIGS